MWIIMGMPLGCGGNGSGKSQDKIEITDKPETPTEITVVDTDIVKSEEQVKREKAKKMIAECKEYYGGIGVTHNHIEDTIVKVHKYYPADEAGILEGDTVINPDELRGEIGTPVVVKIIRKGRRMEFNIIRGKICTKDIIP